MTDAPVTPGNGDYEVGYGRPPKHTRFRKGQSGNPTGRPKGAKNKPKITSNTLNDMLRRELGREVEIRGPSGPEVLSIAQAAARALGVQAVKGNVRAQQQIIALQRDLDTQEVARQAEHDQALVALRNSQLARRDRCRELGLFEEDIIPDPDHIVRDRASGNMIIRGPADRQQKVEWERMWAYRSSFRYEIEKARKKLTRLGPSHVQERKDLTESIETNGYWLTFYNMKLMTVFSLPAWQVSEDRHEQDVLEQRVREGRWPNPPADVRRGLRRDELEALRQGEIRIDAVARDKKWRKVGLAPFKSIFKPAAQVAFEIEQNKSDAEGTETTPSQASTTENDHDLTAERMEQSWIDRFGVLSRLPEDIRADLEAGTMIVSVPAGAQVFAPGQSAENVRVIISGTVRVQRRPENGHRPPPFDLRPGDPCVLALSSEMTLEDYGADGIAVTDVTVVAIPSAVFADVFTRSPDFRMFVFEH